MLKVEIKMFTAITSRLSKGHISKLGGVLEILCQFFKLKHNVMRRIDYDRQIRFQ